MNFDEYQKKAHSTAQYPTAIKLEIRDVKRSLAHGENYIQWTYPALGLSAEVGELMNQLKKVIRDDAGIITEERAVDLKDEMGDILWYMAELCESLHWSLSEISKNNIAKLQLRLKNNQIHGDKR